MNLEVFGYERGPLSELNSRPKPQLEMEKAFIRSVIPTDLNTPICQ